MPPANIEIVRALFDAWKESEPRAALELIDPEIEVDFTGVSFSDSLPSGLVVATAARMAEPVLKSRPIVAAPFIVAAFAAVALLRLPLPYVLLALGPISIATVWIWKRRT